MDPEQDKAAWLERWAEGRTGFHNEQTNPQLIRHWPRLAIPAGARVLVPLAGKSRDLLWLADAGYEVIGNELSPLAVAAFFDEAGLSPRRQRAGAFEAWSAGAITVLCGDFFQLDSALCMHIDGCYDRAALVALPTGLRERYLRHLATLLPARAPVLLVGIDYEQQQMEGPPFAVPETEIRRLAAHRFEVEILAPPSDMLADNPRFAERGLSWMNETVYLLRAVQQATGR